MSQRVGIALIAAFVTCFVGSCAVGTLTVLNAGGSLARELAQAVQPRPEPEPEPISPDEPPASEPEATPPGEDPAEPATTAFETPTRGVGQFAVYRLEKPKQTPAIALQLAAKRAGIPVHADAAPDDAVPPYLVLREFPVKDYAVLEGSFLEAGRGLTAEQKAKLPKSTLPVSVVDVVLPLESERFLEVAKVLAAFAASTGGILWDEETREYFTVDSWRAVRIASWEKGVPQAMSHFTVPVSSGEESASLRTAGLRHFGFAELELREVPLDEVDRAIGLLNATAQTFIEGDLDAAPGPLTVDLSAIRHVGQWKNLEGLSTKSAAKKVDLQLVPGDSEKWPTLELRLGDGVSVAAGLEQLFGPLPPAKPE